MVQNNKRINKVNAALKEIPAKVLSRNIKTPSVDTNLFAKPNKEGKWFFIGENKKELIRTYG